MSEVKQVIRDSRRDVCGTWHGSMAGRLVAALSAEPETLEELDVAMARFIQPDVDEQGRRRSFFGWFSAGINDEPWDAGVVIVDLAARLVVYESTYSSLGREGYVAYHDGHSATKHDLRYHLPDDWKFVSNMESSWRSLADARRSERLALPPLDVRGVLFGRAMIEFVATECLTSFQRRTPAAVTTDGAAIATEPASPPDEDRWGHCDRDVIKDIHRRWLLGPRDDLRGQSPRDAMLAKRSFINWDMQDRCEQWSALGVCPPVLSRDSQAFLFGGFGTHELVEYYYLIRQVLWSCWERLEELEKSPKPSERPAMLSRGDFLTTEVSRLEKCREEWLDSPDPEFHGRTPRSIIDNERLRRPETGSGEDAIVDHDCPLCQMMADMPGPMFWHLDGCNMDDEFAFSIYERTQAEWDEKQRDYEEFNRRFDEKQAEKKRLEVDYPTGGEHASDSIWKRSYSADDAEVPVGVRLFGIGGHLADLIVDLKSPPRRKRFGDQTTDVRETSDVSTVDPRPLIDGLNRDFGNLREVLQTSDVSVAATLFEPVVNRFCDTLSDIATAREDLQTECEELQEQLRRLLEPTEPYDPREFDNGYPF
jgi:hypothetical protein